jgi:hypothetical protein
LLKAAQDEHEANTKSARPHVNAKGLDRDTSAKPLVYSSPELGSDAPAVKTTDGAEQGGDKPAGSGNRRQPPRGNPNRGSRGNKRKR